MGVGDIPAQSNALYVVQPQTDTGAVGNRGRVAAGRVRAGPADSAALVASVRRERRFLERDGSRHRERRGPDCRDLTAMTTMATAAMPSFGTCLLHRRRNRAMQTVYTVNVSNVLIDGVPQSFSYTTTSFDPSTTTALDTGSGPGRVPATDGTGSPATADRSSSKSRAA